VDSTSSIAPFRFWVNDDIDRLHHVAPTGAGYSEDEQDDIDSTEAAANNWQPDWNNNQLQSTRDLEDFTRLWISVQGIGQQLKNGDLFLGLQ
jgi:hypothetical protein